MTKINEDLKPEAHKILKDYQHEYSIRNQGDALNQLLETFDDMQTILSEITSADGLMDFDIGCIICGSPDIAQHQDHTDTCPIGRAIKIIGDKK